MNKRPNSAVIYGSFSLSDVQPRTWIYQHLLDPDPDLDWTWTQTRTRAQTQTQAWTQTRTQFLQTLINISQ